jgi:hypothetical protein
MFPRVLSDTTTFLLAHGASRLGDGPIERLFGRPPALSLVIHGMARGYRPTVVPDFTGTLLYTLTLPATGAKPRRFALRVDGGRAHVLDAAEVDGEPAASLSLPLADFVRIAAGRIDPVEPLLHGRASISGDLALAARLPEMFGAPPLR